MAHKRKKRQFNIKYFIIATAVMLFVLTLIQNWPKACTEEAKICPDGTVVGRVPPNCEFAPCPSCQCPAGYIQEGDVCNPECYYSTPKCLMPSVLCDSITSCESDSDCVGSTCCHPQSCINKAYRGVCTELCSQVCEGPLDCGAGNCGCVNNRCTIIPK